MGAARGSIVVVGAGLGGLSAAIHACLAGFDVVVCEQEAHVGGRANILEHNGCRFDTGPSLLNYPWVFEELFAAAGRRLSDYVGLLPVDPTMRFVWPDGETLTLTTDLVALAAELGRFEPDASAQLMAWLAHEERRFDLVMRRIATAGATSIAGYVREVGIANLLKSGVLQSMRGSLARWFRSEHVRDALGSYAMYLGGSPWRLPGAFAVLPYGELAYGLWLPEGGIYSLVRAIERLACELGVEIRTSCRVDRVLIRERRALGAVLEDGSVLQSSLVIVNGDAPAARARLAPDAVGAPRNPTMTPSVATYYIAARKRPSKLGHHTIFMPADARGAFAELHQHGRIPADLPFYVAIASETDSSLAPPGHSAIFVLVPVPSADRMPSVLDEGIGVRLRERFAARLAQHDMSIDAADVVGERCVPPIDWQRRFGLHHASAFGASHSLRQIGPLRWPNRDPAIVGLYYTGASTTPGTGLPTVVLSGRMTVERILRDAR